MAGKKQLVISYDKETDILRVMIDKSQPSIIEETEDEILIERDVETDEIIGFTILHFEARFDKKIKKVSTPISANLVPA